ncbi:MAG: apolipoprotein N-acyltransferase [Planctomycetota bacterium]
MISILLAVVSGLFLWAAFPPLDFGFLGWVALAPALLAVRGKRWHVRGGIFFITGLSFALLHLMWIIPAGVAGWGLLSVYWALYFAAFGAAFAGEWRGRWGAWLAPVAAAAGWVALEVVRFRILTGFPWSPLAASQHRFPLLLVAGGIAGPFGISAAIAAVNRLAADAAAVFRERRAWRPVVMRARAAGFILGSLLLGGLVLYRAARPAEGDLAVLLVQGNVSQAMKDDPSFIAAEECFSRYCRLTEEFVVRNGKVSDLIVWPETMIPGVLNRDPDRLDRLRRIAAESGGSLLVGAVAVERGTDGRNEFRNSAFLIGEGGILGRYDKVNLVPLGEYIPSFPPFPQVAWLLPKVGDFSRGGPRNLLEVKGRRFGVVICYEGLFPHILREYGRLGAEFVVNLSNEAWYLIGDEHHQHLGMAAVGAAAQRMPVLRVTNDGVSALIAPAGVVRERVRGAGGEDRRVEGTLLVRVPRPVAGGPSPWAAWGEIIEGLWVLAGAIAFCGISLTQKGVLAES